MALTVEEAAVELQVHPETVRRKLVLGELPGVKVGTTWRIPRARLERFLEGEQTS